MSEERMKILKMVEEGKISPEKAEELLNGLEKSDIKPEKDKKKKYLRIYVESSEDNQKINVKIPLSLAKFLKYVKYLVPQSLKEKNERVRNWIEVLNETEWNRILDELGSEEELITVEQESEIVKIWIE